MLIHVFAACQGSQVVLPSLVNQALSPLLSLKANHMYCYGGGVVWVRITNHTHIYPTSGISKASSLLCRLMPNDRILFRCNVFFDRKNNLKTDKCFRGL